MIYLLALLAAFGCALFNGTAAVLQKISADKEERATSLRSGMLIRLLKDWPYLLGLSLDFLAWILTLIAVHSLPLFIVQPIVALSVVVTLLIEVLIFRSRPSRFVNIAIALILIGLVSLMFSATPETAVNVAGSYKIAIITAPLLLIIIGIVFVRGKSIWSTSILAGISGLAFGGTSIVGRMLQWQTPFWRVLFEPLFVSLLAYGIIGLLLFTIALQRHKASIINAIMIIFETLAPIGIGLLLLGDRPKHGLWLLMVFGAVSAVVGVMLIATKSTEIESSTSLNLKT